MNISLSRLTSKQYKHKQHKQSGFTLIELVIVVVILGLLAVTAIPKFIDLTEQAQQANVEGMAGGFATGISLVRAQWEAEGRPQNSGGFNAIRYDGTIVLLTNEDNTKTPSIRPGYVVGLTDGSDLGSNFEVNNCVEIWQSILQQPPTLTASITALNNNNSFNYFVGKSDVSGNPFCHYYLKDSLTRDSEGSYLDPANSTTVGNSFTYQPANSSVIVFIN
jgi:MSHA pilin protein MshB